MSDLYIPKDSLNLKNITFPQIRLGLQGAPGSGKTFSALTFPNPIVVDFDGGLVSHAGRDIPVIPFHSHEWMQTYAGGNFKADAPGRQPSRHLALKHWLNSEGQKLSADQTLIIDSLTTLTNAMANYLDVHPFYTKNGQVDDFAPWAARIDYYDELHTILKSLRCHVVMITHETQVRDEKSGALLDKIAPLLQGKYIAQLKIHYNFWFRCVALEQTKEINGKKFKTGSEYWWQVRSDNQFDAKRGNLVIKDDVFLVKANYSIFKEFGSVSNT